MTVGVSVVTLARSFFEGYTSLSSLIVAGIYDGIMT